MYGHTCAKNNVALRRGWLLAVAIATPMIAVGLVSRSVLGQESGGQTQLEEIIVTATKQAAGQELSKVPISITEIAFECGFASSAHFSTEFRKRFGRSPRSYRQLASRLR